MAARESSQPGAPRPKPSRPTSSSATLYHLSNDDIHTPQEAIDMVRRSPVREDTQTTMRGERPPAIDSIAYFDPASAGGGGPLKRITTQQRERAEQEEREKALRASRGGDNRETSHKGIISRFNFTSKGHRKPQFIIPLHAHDEETHRKSLTGSHLSPSWSSKTLTETPAELDGQQPIIEEEYVYPEGGYGWVVLVCCMALAGCCMGQGMNYGTYQAYYTKTAFPGASSAYIGLVGTINAFFMNAAAFFFGRMGDRFGYKRILYIAGFIAWIGPFIASWCNTLWLLMLFQGIVAGIGQGMATPLFMSLPSQWFYRRRGLASGLALSGAGLGGGTSILIVRELLERVGYKKTLLIMSFLNASFWFIAVIFIRTRPASPEASGGGRGPWADKNVLRRSGFWSIAISLVVATLGYGSAWIYIQSYVELTLPSVQPVLAALPAVLISYCLALGRAMVGAVADRIGPLNTYALVFGLSGAIQLALWLTASSYAQICAFAIIYGLVAPGFLGLIPQIVVQLFGPANLASNVGLLILFNGPGNMAGPPIAGAIYDAGGRTTFKWVIIMSGCLQLAGGIIASWAKFKASRRPFAKV